ncbi:SDR family oxidoreductase [Micromonospora sp. NPDC049662]|uniref:SDR family oxidoreductase n=1 Tax=Micromonospora sp. NPDC049662 TaxID=3155397 RepID=UPI0034134F0E
MRITGSVALVTGANRGLGRALARALIDHGAAKVYAGVRDPSALPDDDVTPVRLDVTDAAAVAAAAEALTDVNVVINNAAASTEGSPLTVPLAGVRRDLEVNYLGLLSVAQAFAPVLATNGGGALVNVLSALAWTTAPPISSLAASKAAAWSMTNALRLSLRKRGTLVMAVHCDTIDTDMSRGVVRHKHDPRYVAEAVVQGLANDDEEVLVDDHARAVKAALSEDIRVLYP